MTLNLIAGLPATTDLAQARVFPFRLDAIEMAEHFNSRLAACRVTGLSFDAPNASTVPVEVVAHYLPSGRRCWVLRQNGGARTVGKYVAEITVEDCRQPRSV